MSKEIAEKIREIVCTSDCKKWDNCDPNEYPNYCEKVRNKADQILTAIEDYAEGLVVENPLTSMTLQAYGFRKGITATKTAFKEGLR